MRNPLLLGGSLLFGLLLVAIGYWGPWIWAEPAGLRVLGIDLAEYVKFLAEVRSGQIAVQREVFYLPPLALSVTLSLLAHRREYRLPSPLRWLLNLLAIPTALAMLPPAWTPPLLTTPEFSKQTAAIVICLAMAALAYPLGRRLPGLLLAAVVLLLSLAATVGPVAAFARLQPAFDNIYGHPITVGYGPWLMSTGFALVTITTLLAVRTHRPRSRHPLYKP